MPLFVFGLRLFTLFLNVYDTYKVLKLPPPSSRNNGLPSQRALMQRKRDMKGVLAVWIVWCCLTLYERFGESLVSIFIPFYDEIKSIFLLFLIMTRARGAEPIFLHVIRPFLSPYAPTLDLLLDFIHMLGDMWFTAILSPFSAARGLMGHSDSGSEDASDGGSSGRQTPVEAQSNGALGSNSLNRQSNVSSESATTSSSHPQSRTYEIWHPPQSTHSDSEETLHDDSGPTEVSFMTEEAKEANEWRQYPAIPSAYPATPVFVQKKKLPGNGQSAPQPSLMSVLESANQPDFNPNNEPRTPTPEHDTNEDLLRSPGARGLLSEDDMSGAEYDEDDEDVFNTTLRTPPPVRPRNLPTPSQPANRSSIGSILANGIKPRSSTASLHSRNGSAADSRAAPNLQKRESSNTISGRSVHSRESIPKALRTGPLLKQSDGDSEEEVVEDTQSATKMNPTIRRTQSTIVRSAAAAAKTQSMKTGSTRQPTRPVSSASLRSASNAGAGEKTRPVTQRKSTPLSQATNR